MNSLLHGVSCKFNEVNRRVLSEDVKEHNFSNIVTLSVFINLFLSVTLRFI